MADTPLRAFEPRQPSFDGQSSTSQAALEALDAEWQTRYKSVEDRCNALSGRAVQTIQECKVRMTQLQKENLEMQETLRDMQETLQQREMEKSRAMTIIPRLVEMVKKYELEAQFEKQKRQMDKEFDNLRLVATTRSNSASTLSVRRSTMPSKQPDEVDLPHLQRDALAATTEE